MDNSKGMQIDQNKLKNKKAEVKISRATKEKAESAKNFIERFLKIIQKNISRRKMKN